MLALVKYPYTVNVSLREMGGVNRAKHEVIDTCWGGVDDLLQRNFYAHDSEHFQMTPPDLDDLLGQGFDDGSAIWLVVSDKELTDYHGVVTESTFEEYVEGEGYFDIIDQGVIIYRTRRDLIQITRFVRFDDLRGRGNYAWVIDEDDGTCERVNWKTQKQTAATQAEQQLIGHIRSLEERLKGVNIKDPAAGDELIRITNTWMGSAPISAVNLDGILDEVEAMASES
ncbi:hypothetical protein [uncultured Umboniibacter sp.]|uniref:hypothetical protein n=1 Tax=uncultured Umboniibacter sp. TaxID=1798917 RepID=UPI00261A9450|nr:hypothetical protein [uncultured Umboniibacter sp.]